MSGITSSEFFDAMVYGLPDDNTVATFKEATARVASYIPQQFHKVHQRMTAAVDRLGDVNYRNAIKMATAHISSAWVGDYIRPLVEVPDIQAASPIMQRYIMAEPTYRALYNEGQANGYGKDYFDAQPGALANDHLDYKRVTHGLWVEDDEGDSMMTVYDTDVSHDDESEELTLIQQVDITATWLSVRYEAEKKRNDIGCPLGGSL